MFGGITFLRLSLIEVLRNLKHAGVFQKSTTVNLRIGFKEPLTCPGIKKICFSTWQHGGYTNSSLLEGAVIMRKYHAMLLLRNEMKLDVIL